MIRKDRLSNTNRNGKEKLKRGEERKSDKQMNCGKETG